MSIVFVHGLAGHPVHTWIYTADEKMQQTDNNNESTEPPPKKLKFSSLVESQEKEINTATYWPQDMVPLVIPNARVLTYGYDTHIRNKLGSHNNGHTVYDIAWGLLIALEAERRMEPSGPIYFIVHSLGGIIVKEMLRKSNDSHQSQAYLSYIYNSTIGLMFFGTPHNGVDSRGSLQHLIGKAIRAAGFICNEEVVNVLLSRAECLQEPKDDFNLRAQH